MNEPVVQDSLNEGADVALFSGDKLIGGPQCGIIVGKSKWIKTILANPLMRAMRVDKMTLAALHATLLLYRDPETVMTQVPILRMLSMPIANLKMRADKIADQIKHSNAVQDCEVVEEQSMLGGGSLPTQKIPTWCVSIAANGSIDSLAEQLRKNEPAIMGRVQKDRLMLDMRTVDVSDDSELVEVFNAIS